MNHQFPISAQAAEPWAGLCLVAPKNEWSLKRGVYSAPGEKLGRMRTQVCYPSPSGKTCIHQCGWETQMHCKLVSNRILLVIYAIACSPPARQLEAPTWQRSHPSKSFHTGLRAPPVNWSFLDHEKIRRTRGGLTVCWTGKPSGSLFQMLIPRLRNLHF